MNHLTRFALSGGLLTLIVCARQLTGTWANPVGFYAGTFMLVAMAQQAFLPSLPFGVPVAWLILGSAMMLLFGMVVTHRQTQKAVLNPRVDISAYDKVRLLGLVLAFAFALAHLWVLWQARATGIGVTDSGGFDRATFFASGGQSPVQRGLQALTYCGVLYVAFEARHRKHTVALVGGYMLVVLAQGIIFSTKLPMLISTLIVLGVFAVGLPARFQRIDRRAVVAAAGAVLAMVVTFQIVTMQRHRGVMDVWQTIGYSLLGPPSAYSLVLEGKAPIHLEPRWGISVAGARDVLMGAGDRREFGVFANTVQLHPGKMESVTNIYTWFVPLRHDFGIVGMLVMLFGLGLLAGGLTLRQTAGRLGAFGQTALVLINLELMFAPIFTLSYYNFVPLLLLLGAFMGMLYRKRVTHRAAAPASSGVVTGESAVIPTSRMIERPYRRQEAV